MESNPESFEYYASMSITNTMAWSDTKMTTNHMKMGVAQNPEMLYTSNKPQTNGQCTIIIY
jgi:hypothetical protein